MRSSTVTGVLRERASLQPDDTAFTFFDYEQDWDGFAHELTWAQLNRRVLSLAEELRSHAAAGDRVVILAPQSLEYVVGFLASLQANLIAVPLSVPAGGAHDERVNAVLNDATPSVLLTTTAAVGAVVEYAIARNGSAAPTVVEVDALDLDTRRRSTSRRETGPETAYLQYTSGSTRTPAGVMVSHRNLTANFEQVMCDFFPDNQGVSPPNTTAVSWLPFYHDMGLMLGVCAPILGGWHTVFTTPLSFLAAPRPLAAAALRLSQCGDRRPELRVRTGRVADLRRRHGRPGHGQRAARAQRQRTGSRGDPQAVRAALRQIQFPAGSPAAVLRSGRGHAVCGDQPARPGAQRHQLRAREAVGRSCQAVRERKRHAAGQLRQPAVAGGAHRRSGVADRVSGRHRSARSGCRATTCAWATGTSRTRPRALSALPWWTRPGGPPTDSGCAPAISASSPRANCSSSAASRIC